MKHAGEAALDELEPVLRSVRKRSQLTEKKRGKFYRKSSAFLHFHEDPEGLFADLKVDGAWQRQRVSTKAEREQLLRSLDTVLMAIAAPRAKPPKPPKP